MTEATTETSTTEKEEKKIVRTAAATLKKYRDKGNYPPSAGYSGISFNNGDAIATALRMSTPKQVMAVAEKILPGIKRGELKKKYASLNEGMKRMNSGNRIRAAIKKGTITEAQLLTALGIKKEA